MLKKRINKADNPISFQKTTGLFNTFCSLFLLIAGTFFKVPKAFETAGDIF